ncbi:PREDICTED: protein ELYS-like [Priapulus caudatus]|uniref:Protein ELYS-like n=1 Tax=Priapulus caudatus TaxID=37621 RepID=A0ABM1DP15_PRICU|nr:PREDICTED: protein ELYS-like [Priapulus caudatus]
MRGELLPNFTSKFVPFCEATADCISAQLPKQDAALLGGLFEDGGLAWVARGGSLEVIDTVSGLRQAAWQFGTILNDDGVAVTCVSDYQVTAHCSILLVGLDMSGRAGMLCLFDPVTSTVRKAIAVKDPVTCVEPVCGADAADDTLSEHLQWFHGVVAVGTRRGHVYLLDLCCDERTYVSDEVSSSSMRLITARTPNVQQCRDDALHRRQHLCLEVGDDSHRKGKFQYRKPDSSIMETLTADAVWVTCAKYVKEIGMLAVGFNFGCFQLWSLSGPNLEYSSQFECDLSPITKVAYQEPENDPRNYNYLWVASGPLSLENSIHIPASLWLYQLAFSKKCWLHESGFYFYEEFQSCGPRYEFNLTEDPYNQLEDTFYGSRLISCATIGADRQAALRGLGDDEQMGEDSSSEEEDRHSNDLSLCAFVWETQPSHPTSQSQFVLGIFDMNRWYHAQMPTSLRPGSSDCSYFAFFSISSAVDDVSSEVMLNVHIPPSSLASVYCCGTTRPALLSIIPVIWLSDLSCNIQHREHLTFMPEMLLTVVLILIPKLEFLAACVREMSEVQCVESGCTLRFLFEWAWSKVIETKVAFDKLVVPLYNWSGVQLDDPAVRSLYQHSSRLQHLINLYRMVLDSHTFMTTQGATELNVRLKVLTLLSQHIEVVIWFVDKKLLPENEEGQQLYGDLLAYPAQALSRITTARRREMRERSGSREMDVLLIDGLIASTGDCITQLWGKADGNGLYPPPSLHELLNVYLLDDVPLEKKHCLVLYLLIDLMSICAEQRLINVVDELRSFWSAFRLPEGKLKLMQAFWLFDHGDLEDAVNLFLHPMVNHAVAYPWQHALIMKTLLHEGESSLALRYMRIMQPVSNDVNDVSLKISVLVENGLIAEAHSFQREHAFAANSEVLFRHFFTACMKTKCVYQLLQLPLDSLEEQYLVTFLKKRMDEVASGELLVMYLLQRARYIEALQLNESLKRLTMVSMDRAVRERVATRNLIVDMYMKTLPDVQRKLALHPDAYSVRPTYTKRFARPKPLSTVVTQSKMKTMTLATLFETMLEKVGELKPKESSDDWPEVDSHVPFLSTPITPRRHASRIRRVSDGEAHVDHTLRFYKAPELSADMFVSRAISPQQRAELSKIKERLMRSTLPLLQTPPVVRQRARTASQHRDATPQSILKVREAIALSPSPTLTRARAKPLRESLDESAQKTSSAAGSSSKQLRFVLPDNDISLIPSEEDGASRRASLTSIMIRSRVPTPKRTPRFSLTPHSVAVTTKTSTDSVAATTATDSDSAGDASIDISGVEHHQVAPPTVAEDMDTLEDYGDETPEIEGSVEDQSGERRGNSSSMEEGFVGEKANEEDEEQEEEEEVQEEEMEMDDESFHTPQHSVVVDEDITFVSLGRSTGRIAASMNDTAKSSDSIDTVPIIGSPAGQPSPDDRTRVSTPLSLLRHLSSPHSRFLAGKPLLGVSPLARASIGETASAVAGSPTLTPTTGGAPAESSSSSFIRASPVIKRSPLVRRAIRPELEDASPGVAAACDQSPYISRREGHAEVMQYSDLEGGAGAEEAVVERRAGEMKSHHDSEEEGEELQADEPAFRRDDDVNVHANVSVFRSDGEEVMERRESAEIPHVNDAGAEQQAEVVTHESWLEVGAADVTPPSSTPPAMQTLGQTPSPTVSAAMTASLSPSPTTRTPHSWSPRSQALADSLPTVAVLSHSDSPTLQVAVASSSLTAHTPSPPVSAKAHMHAPSSPTMQTSFPLSPTMQTTTHLLPVIQMSTHLSLTVQTSPHLSPTMQTSPYLSPAMQTSPHLSPTMQTSTHLSPAMQTSTHLSPAMQTSTHLSPTMQPSTHLLPTVQTLTDMSPTTRQTPEPRHAIQEALTSSPRDDKQQPQRRDSDDTVTQVTPDVSLIASQDLEMKAEGEEVTLQEEKQEKFSVQTPVVAQTLRSTRSKSAKEEESIYTFAKPLTVTAVTTFTANEVDAFSFIFSPPLMRSAMQRISLDSSAASELGLSVAMATRSRRKHDSSASSIISEAGETSRMVTRSRGRHDSSASSIVSEAGETSRVVTRSRGRHDSSASSIVSEAGETSRVVTRSRGRHDSSASSIVSEMGETSRVVTRSRGRHDSSASSIASEADETTTTLTHSALRRLSKDGGAEKQPTTPATRSTRSFAAHPSDSPVSLLSPIVEDAATAAGASRTTRASVAKGVPRRSLRTIKKSRKILAKKKS